MEDFLFPNSSEDQKTAPLLQRSDADQSQIIGGYIPHIPPAFRRPRSTNYTLFLKF